MITLALIPTPHNTKMAAIILDNALRNELIEKKHVEEAVRLLYGKSARITKIAINNSAPHLEQSVCLDYCIEVESEGKKHTMYNFACCFLDSKDCKKLHENNALENIMQCLKNMRAERVMQHPLYYKEYAKSILAKFEATIKG